MIQEIKLTSRSGRGSVVMKTRDRQGYWLGPVDWGQVQGQHQAYSYYNQVGESIVSTTVLPRSISITGWVLGDAVYSLQSRCDFLNAFISPVDDYDLEYSGRKIQFRPDSSVAYSREILRNNEKVRRFLIQGTCPHPLFSGAEDTAVGFDFSGKLFHFPTDFGRKTPLVFGTTEKAYRVDIYNSGGFSTGITAQIEFSGTVQNPRIWNLKTEKYIGVNRTFSRFERLEICTLAGDKHITLYKADGSSENLIKYRDVQTTWIQLEPGANRLSLDCENLDQRPNMDVTIYYTPLYLEVE